MHVLKYFLDEMSGDWGEPGGAGKRDEERGFIMRFRNSKTWENTRPRAKEGEKRRMNGGEKVEKETAFTDITLEDG